VFFLCHIAAPIYSTSDAALSRMMHCQFVNLCLLKWHRKHPEALAITRNIHLSTM